MIRGGVRRLSGRRIPCRFVLRASLAVPPELQQKLGLDSLSQHEVNEPVESRMKEMS
jgi:hypothetical protein